MKCMLNDVPDGVYFLQLEDGEFSYQARIIKQD